MSVAEPRPLEVVLATHNAHKVAEFQHILGERMPGLTVLPYDGPEPVEEGVTFAENAFIKARTAAELRPEEKDARSHRALAFEQLLPELERVAALVGG